jgi:FMN reductase
MKISIVVGNPKPASRTRTVAESLVDHMFRSGHDIQVMDLAHYVDRIFAWPSDEMACLSARVAESDVAVFATPTYKASYTGLLKAFLDRYPASGLAGVTAIPVFTGADLTHSMGPDVNLAPLLVELGAIVPGRGLYFVASHMDRLDELVSEAAASYIDRIRRIARVSDGLD